jgi:hypothetical protein
MLTFRTLSLTLLAAAVWACSSQKAPPRTNPMEPIDAAADAATQGSGGSDAGESGYHGPAPALGAPCNGNEVYCSRTYDALSFAATHESAANSSTLWLFPTQDQTVRAQLDGGIRALMLSVQEQAGGLRVCRSDCAQGSTSLGAVLGVVKEFLDVNPREVVTLLVDSNVAASKIQADFVQQRLDTNAYTPTAGLPWPTLGQMVDNNWRLVVFANMADAGVGWLIPRNQTIWETGSRWTSLPSMTCSPDVGDASRPLYLVHHYLTAEDSGSDAGASSASLATQADDIAVVSDRLQACVDEYHRVPNFVAFDFFENGDTVGATQIINGVRSLP